MVAVEADAAVAEDSEEDGLQERAIGGGKHAALGVALDEAFRVIMPLRPRAEGGDGGLADVEVLRRHVPFNVVRVRPSGHP